MKLKNLKLRTKQVVGFGLLLFMLGAINGYTLFKLGTINRQIDAVTNNWFQRAVVLSELNVSAISLRLSQLQHANSSETKSIEKVTQIIDEIEDNKERYEALATVAKKENLYSTEEEMLFEGFKSQWLEYQDYSLQFFTLTRDNKRSEAITLLNREAELIFREFKTVLQNLVLVNKSDAEEAARAAAETFRQTRNLNRTLFFITSVLSLLFAIGLVRLVTVPVRKLQEGVSQIASGNLDVQIPVTSNDELGALSAAFNQMTLSLKEATEKMQQQANILQQNNQLLESQKTEIVKQKAEIEAKNTELKDTLAELRNAQERLLLKEKMASLGDLVAGIAHEINSPIGTVNSSIDVIKRCTEKIEKILKDENNETNAADLKVLNILNQNIEVSKQATIRISTLVKSLKNFARLDQASSQKVDIHPGIDSAIHLLGSEVLQRIQIEKDYGKILPINCYPGELNQVFMNILRNAVEAIEKSGKIIVKTYSKDAKVFVEIKDNGKGISAEKLPKIFEFGFSTDQSRVKMGAGLTTAYSIIQRHSGDIFVQSEPEKGSIFTIVIPETK